MLNGRRLSLLYGVLLVSILALAGFLQVYSAASPDAIGVRVAPNPKHYSAIKWYQSQGFKGSPQVMIVDGYEAIRDGRSVYIDAANIVEAAPANNQLSINDQFFTNIFIISYNQDAEKATADIFGQLVANWKFNNNILTAGACDQTAAQSCVYTKSCAAPDCPTCQVKEYCISSHDVSVRDTKRLSDLADLNDLLANYKAKNGGLCPKLESGSYLPNKSLSTWPSWQETLGKALGTNLPFDPINKMGACLGYNAQTCWNETTKLFDDPTPADANFDLPSGTRAYTYLSSPNGQQCAFYVNTESGLTCTSAGVCTVTVNLGAPVAFSAVGNPGAGTNTPPKIISINAPTSIRYTPYQGVIQAQDDDNDPLTWTLTTIGDWSTWVAPTLQTVPGNPYQRKLVSTKSGNFGNYNFMIQVDDGRGGIATATSMVKVGNFCEDKDGDGYGVCPNCGIAKGCTFNANDCDDEPALHPIVGTRGPVYVLGQNIKPGIVDNCANYNGLDNNCDGSVSEKAQIVTLVGGQDNFEGATGFNIGPMQAYTYSAISSAENRTPAGSKSALLSQDITPSFNALYPNLLLGSCTQTICNSLQNYNGNCIWNNVAQTCTTPGDPCGKTVFNLNEGSSCWGGAFDQNSTYLNFNQPFGNQILPGLKYIVSFYYKGVVTPSASLRIAISGYPGWESQIANPVTYPPGRTCRGVWPFADFIKSSDGSVTGTYNLADADECYAYWHDASTTLPSTFEPTHCFCALHAKSAANQTASFPSSYGGSIGAGVYSSWTYNATYMDLASSLGNVKDDVGNLALRFSASMGYNNVDQTGTKLYIDDFTIEKCTNIP